MNTSTRRFSNLSDSTVYVVQINGDEGCYFLTDDNGDARVFTGYGAALDALDHEQAGGEYGEIQTFEPGETLDMDDEGEPCCELCGLSSCPGAEGDHCEHEDE